MNDCKSLLFVLVACLFAGSGASCPRRDSRQLAPAPAAFVNPPTLDEVIGVVNGNSARVHRLQTAGATLTVDGASLRADLALERPRRFRLRGHTTLSGEELDLGSNDNVFWVWVRRDPNRAVYFAEHNQLDDRNVRAKFPVPPEWLIDALGLVQFDPHGVHEGPFQNHAGRLEIRSREAAPYGVLNKITVIDAVRGWVLEQRVFDESGQLLASATALRHQYDPVNGVSLPRQVTVSLPMAQMSFTIQVDDYLVNQLYTDPRQLWSMPQPAGFSFVNFADPRLSLTDVSQVTARIAAPLTAGDVGMMND